MGRSGGGVGEDNKVVRDRGGQGFTHGVYILLNIAKCSSSGSVQVSCGEGRAVSGIEAREAQGGGVCAG